MFTGYFLGLMVTDGYLATNSFQFGLDLTDEDCIKYISLVTGKGYQKIEKEGQKDVYRIIFNDKIAYNQLIERGAYQNKTFLLDGLKYTEDEGRFLPYIIRGVIDGDGSVFNTQKGTLALSITTASEKFAEWLKNIFINKLYFDDIAIYPQKEKYFSIETSNYNNIQKLKYICYNKPFGMTRKRDKLFGNEK